jgi:energy-coupling factor transport system permease protein
MEKVHLQSKSNQNSINIDPRTKIFILLIINISVFTINVWYILALAALIPVSLFAIRKNKSLAMSFSLVYTVSLVFYVFFIEATNVISIMTAMVTGIVNRMGPGFLMGYYLISTTTVSEFIAAMERMRIPKQIIIPFSVMFRFFPTIKEESSSIKDAMRMRGISFGKTKGSIITLMEYRLIPLFISCVKIGEELSCSALTRGLGSPQKRTNICNIGFSRIDLLYGILATFILVLWFISKGV